MKKRPGKAHRFKMVKLIPFGILGFGVLGSNHFFGLVQQHQCVIFVNGSWPDVFLSSLDHVWSLLAGSVGKNESWEPCKRSHVAVLAPRLSRPGFDSQCFRKFQCRWDSMTAALLSCWWAVPRLNSHSNLSSTGVSSAAKKQNKNRSQVAKGDGSRQAQR